MPKTATKDYLKIVKKFRDYKFVDSSEFYWSAIDKTIHFDSSRMDSEEGLYKLIHEIGHAESHHKNFTSGIKLLSLETEAWVKAKDIASTFDLNIPEKFIEHSLDSYRDWLHKRSTCPTCKTVGIESNENQYRCFNCRQKWAVSGDQRSRCYRQKSTQLKQKDAV